MLFKKTISTLLAFGTIGATLLAPVETQAISVSTFVGDFPENNKWETQFKQNSPQYSVPLARVYYGQASWYGPGFFGNQTASGSIYRPGTMTAAHRSLPFGTKVRVTNLNNGRSRIVTINDRGPFIGGRIIDLGDGAASSLGVKSSGVVPVRLEVLD